MRTSRPGITGWGALDGHKVFRHQTYINPAAGLAFKPVRMPETASKAIGCTANSPGIRVEKYRCDAEHNIVQIDIEYWRFESVYFFVEL